MKRAKSATFDKDPKQIIQTRVELNRECFGEKYRPINTISDVMDKFSEIFGLKLKPYDYTSEWVDQKSEELEAFFYIIKESAPFLNLMDKIADTYRVNKTIFSQDRKLGDDAIIEMVKNFEKIDRSGRKRLIKEYDLEDWQNFAHTHANVIEFGFEASTPALRSMYDFRQALETKGITKADLETCFQNFKLKFGDFKCSTRTLYRRGLTELVRFRKVLYYIECTIQNYDTYFK